MIGLCRNLPHLKKLLSSYFIVWIYYSLFHQFYINGLLSCLPSFAVKNSPAKMMYCVGLFSFAHVSVGLIKVGLLGQRYVILLDAVQFPL